MDALHLPSSQRDLPVLRSDGTIAEPPREMPKMAEVYFRSQIRNRVRIRNPNFQFAFNIYQTFLSRLIYEIFACDRGGRRERQRVSLLVTAADLHSGGLTGTVTMANNYQSNLAKAASNPLENRDSRLT